MPSLLALPSEIIGRILSDLPPASHCNVARTHSALTGIAEALIWADPDCALLTSRPLDPTEWPKHFTLDQRRDFNLSDGGLGDIEDRRTHRLEVKFQMKKARVCSMYQTWLDGLQRQKRRVGSVRRLHLCLVMGCLDMALAVLLAVGSNLADLRISMHDENSPYSPQSAIEVLPIFYRRLNGTPSAGFGHLRHLHLDVGEDWHDGFAGALGLCPALERLGVTFCQPMFDPDPGESSGAWPELQPITRLDFVDVELDHMPIIIALLKKSPNCSYLAVESIFDPSELMSVAHAHYLRSLDQLTRLDWTAPPGTWPKVSTPQGPESLFCSGFANVEHLPIPPDSKAQKGGF